MENNNPSILIALKDFDYAHTLKNRIENKFGKTVCFDKPGKLTGSKLYPGINCIIIDIDFTLQTEIDIINFLKTNYCSAEIIVLCKIKQIDRALKALHNGAFLYLVVPVKEPDLLFVTKTALKKSMEKVRYCELRKYMFEEFIGNSPQMQKVKKIISKISRTTGNVLLLGESGTGKEVIARAIHFQSQRVDENFVAVNCAAIPEKLLESELFGYVKGAFTGADDNKEGLIQHANGGTFFLDEIGEMPTSLQAKLLRVLDSHEIRPLGSKESFPVDIRIISATNQDLEQMVNKGCFREDLFYRINVIRIHIPPLRERKEDIPFLVRYFIHRFNNEYKKTINNISKHARNFLVNYSYPGNVRELENIIQHAVIFAENDEIQFDDLPADIFTKTLSLPYSYNKNEFPDEKNFSIKNMEESLIKQALLKHKGNRDTAAKELGISRTTLWRKMKKYGVE